MKVIRFSMFFLLIGMKKRIFWMDMKRVGTPLML
jgi:hypothetical protein